MRKRARKRAKKKGKNCFLNGIWAQSNGLNQQRADRGAATDEHSSNLLEICLSHNGRHPKLL